jgi:ribosomal protein S4
MKLSKSFNFDIRNNNNTNIRLFLSDNKLKAPPVFPQYFEKLKYYPQVHQNKIDHSFLWQKWMQELNSKNEYYSQLQRNIAGLPEKSTGVTTNNQSRFLLSQKGLYHINSSNINTNVRRKKVNFFTYRKFRFNQLRLFYTTCNQRQFKHMYNNYNYIKKSVLDHFLLSLEGRLEFFLYRINFFPSKYFIRQFLQHHGVLVNGYLVRDKNYILKPWDRVGLPRGQYNKVFSLLKDRTAVLRYNEFLKVSKLAVKKSLFRKFSSLNLSPLFSLNFLTNYPRYLEVDYVLLEAMFIRYPTLKELVLPPNSEISNTNRSYYKW